MKNDLTILIVNDGDVMLKDTLSNDYNLVHASDDKSAIDAALKYTPSLILIGSKQSNDASLKVVCKKLKNCSGTQFIPIILVTSMNSEFSDRTHFEFGVVDCISKTLSQPDFRSQIKVNLLLRTRLTHF